MPTPDHQHDIDIAKVAQRAKDIEDKLPKLKSWMEQGKLILSLVKDYWSGQYREVPYWVLRETARELGLTAGQLVARAELREAELAAPAPRPATLPDAEHFTAQIGDPVRRAAIEAEVAKSVKRGRKIEPNG